MFTTNVFISIDLNELEVRPQREIVKIEADPSSEKFLVTQQKDLADNVLVVGERYQLSDIRSSTSCALGKFSCGVLGWFIDWDLEILIIIIDISFRCKRRNEKCI